MQRKPPLNHSKISLNIYEEYTTYKVKRTFKYKELQIAATAALDSTDLKLTNMRVAPNLQSYRHSKASIN
jgi:hypothetical protein